MDYNKTWPDKRRSRPHSYRGLKLKHDEVEAITKK